MIFDDNLREKQCIRQWINTNQIRKFI